MKTDEIKYYSINTCTYNCTMNLQMKHGPNWLNNH